MKKWLSDSDGNRLVKMARKTVTEYLTLFGCYFELHTIVGCACVDVDTWDGANWSCHGRDHYSK